MPIDAQIPLSVQPAPAISPMQSIGQLMQLKDVSSQVALRQAQTQHFQQQAEQERAVTEQKNRDLQAVKNLQGLLSDPSSYTKIAQGDYAPIYQHGGITPGVADAFIKENDVKRTTAQTLKTGQAGLYAGQRSILQNGLEGVMSEKDDVRSASQYQQLKAELSKEAPDIAQHLPDLSAGPTYRQQLSDLSNVNGFHHALLQHAADEEAKKATALKETSQGNLATSEALIKSRQLVGMNESGLLPEEQVRAQQAAATLAATQQAHAETARHNIADEAAARSRIGLEAARNRREQQIYEQTYGEGSNEALRGVEPKLRVPATKEAQKAADEHEKAVAAQRDMETFIDLAKSGNKEAHAYLSPEGVLTLNTGRGVTRVNRQEMEAYAGAGSLFDTIAGKVGKLTSGQSVPPDVLNDIAGLHQRISQNSASTYNDKIKSINQNYRSNFKPVEAGGSSGGTIRARDPQGRLHEAPAGSALPAGWKLEK